MSAPSKLPQSSFGPLDTLMSEDAFIKDFVKLYSDNPKFRKSIAVCFVKGIVKKLNSKKGAKPEHEAKVISFSKYMYSVCPEAARILNSNFSGPTEQWMKRVQVKDDDDECVL